MSTVGEIIEAVKKLPEREKSEFLESLADVDFDDAWDRQIEADAKAGKLHDALSDFSGHVIPRLALLLFVLCLPREDDRFSLDCFLKR